MAEPAEFILNALIALLGGTLIGLERERAQLTGSEAKTGSIPGMRSFGVLAVYGAVVAYAAGTADSLLVAASLAAFTMLLGFHAYTRMVKQGVLGVTTYIVMLATFFMGVLAGLGLRIESAALSVIVTLVLALKRPAERLAKALRYDELLAMLEVAAIALVLGPIIRAYSEAYGAGIVFKVYAFFTIVLLLSLASYAAARLWGARGILYAAALGSLVNSEATISSVTSIVGELADPDVRKRLLRQLIPTIIAVLQVRASMLMILAAYIFTGTIPAEVAYAASLIALAGLAILALSTAKSPATPQASLSIQSPLSWSSAVKSAAAYLALTLAFTTVPSTAAAGLAAILLSFLGGLVNATATILSLATTLKAMGTCTAAAAMATAIAAATINKILYAETSRLTRAEHRLIILWSLGASLVPLAVAATIYLAC